MAGTSFLTGNTAQHAFRYDGTPGSGGVMHELGSLNTLGGGSLGLIAAGTRAYLLDASSIVPEPSGLALLALALPALLRRRHQSRQRQPIGRACLEALEHRRLLSLTPAMNYPVGQFGAGPQAVVTADFNNDGNFDLVTANPDFHFVSVLLGDGGGGFGAAIDSAGTTNDAFERVSVAVADFNNDGDLDLATAMYGYYEYSTFGRLDVWMGNGDGTFQSPTLVRGGAPLAVAAGDFNNDGNSDLVFTADLDGQQGFVQVLPGNGLGGFTTSGWGLGSNYAAGLAVGDLNGDGNLDAVAVAGEFGSDGAAFLGNGAGRLFTADVFFSTIWLPARAVAVGDFTGDGIPDLVVSGGAVEIFTGLGDGTFDEPIVHSANGYEHTGVAVADFNGDGKFDVVTSDGDTGTVSLLLGNGDGTVRYIGAFATGSSPSAVAVGDFNGDGRPDVAAANAGSNNVSVLLNDGVWGKTFVGPGGNGSGGNWSHGGNWSPPGVPAAGDHVSIAGKSVNLAASSTVGGLTLTGGASLTVAANGTRVLRTAGLSISTGSKLDLKDNDLIVDYTGASPVAAVETSVRSAYNAGWSGTGITSSVAAAQNGYTLAVADNATLAAPFGTAQGGPLFGGADVDLTTVLVKFTHRADVNLDGLVTPDDSAVFGGNYSENDFGTWATGDMDYDGLFTPSDATIFGGFYDDSLPLL